MALAEDVLAGDVRAVARAISLIEDETDAAAAFVSRIFPHTGRAYLIGMTGAPGVGKSSLVDRLIEQYRRRDLRVAVLAVDPTSPYTGGAVLGDRVRMQRHAGDAGVFIRSMATRGQLGGLAGATAEAAMVLDAAGFDCILIETVGVGQAEVDVVKTADVAVVVMAPGGGDDIQAQKAGLMEIADIFVVNKSDRDGADRTRAAIEAAVALAPIADGQWTPPVLPAVATTGDGLGDIVAAIDRFRTTAVAAHRDRRRARAESRFREMLTRQLWQRLETQGPAPAAFDAFVDQIAARTIDPRAAAASALASLFGNGITLDHVGIAVEDAAALVAVFRNLFGVRTGEPEDLEGHRLRFVETGPAAVELVESLSESSPIAAFLKSRGSALHHICLRVPDIDAALARLKAMGVRLVDEVPRPGGHGSRIAFLHPSATGRILVEIKQPRG